MLSIRSISSIEDPDCIEVLQMEQKISSIERQLYDLGKTAKKLEKLENKLDQTNLLIDSGIGSKNDKKDLAKTKKDIRARRVQLWAKLERVAPLENELATAMRDLDILRRRIGLL